MTSTLQRLRYGLLILVACMLVTVAAGCGDEDTGDNSAAEDAGSRATGGASFGTSDGFSSTGGTSTGGGGAGGASTGGASTGGASTGGAFFPTGGATGGSMSDGSTNPGTVPGPAPGVSQGGAQDFGLFKGILEAGDIPAPGTLDDVGFFNEHSLAFPAPTCNEDLCIHGLLGVMGNMLNGANCTLVTIGMNTPLDPANMPRPPLDLALAVDTSGSMAGANIEFVRDGLLQMLNVLAPEDRVSLIEYNSNATILVEYTDAGDPALRAAITGLTARGSTNIYAGLRSAFDVIDRNRATGRQQRVVLLSDGVATVGITNDERLLRLGASYAQQGVGITTIGMGDAFNLNLMQRLSEQGSGNFYFLESPEAAVEVFTEEVETFLLALAEDVQIHFEVGGGYTLRNVYGTKLASRTPTTTTIEVPSLFIAHRRGASDNSRGRRGGGGGIIVELTPSLSPTAGFDPNNVGELVLDYRIPATEMRMTQRVNVRSELLPGDTPDEGLFDTPTVAKAFVMLNIFVGFQLASERAQVGANAEAMRILTALGRNVERWLETNDDPDIRDDLRFIDMFIQNLAASRNVQVVPDGEEIPPPSVPDPWPND